MPSRSLVHAWGALVVLSGATTLLTLSHSAAPARPIVAVAVLVLAGLKARVILSRYLGLDASRFWTRSFDLLIGGFLSIAYVLYLFGGPS